MGSVMSFVSALLFFYIVYDMFMTQVPNVARNPWRKYPTKIVNGQPIYEEAVTAVAVVTLFNAPMNWQMAFQEPGTHVMEKIVDLHHDVMFFLIIIVFFVG